MVKINSGLHIKTPGEVEIMAEGGRKLKEVKVRLQEAVVVGANAYDIDKIAEEAISKLGGKPSFKMVPGYHWTTCINVNDGIVHGIPRRDIVFKKGDIVSVDVGLYFKGFHVDTSFSVGLSLDNKTKSFLEVGQEAFNRAVKETRIGNRVYDISKAIESTLKKANLSPVRALVGHGVGRSLHEEPQIPCFTYGKRGDSLKIIEGMVLAIEVMYSKGSGDVSLAEDGWTIVTSDGTISALFEDTIAVTQKGPKVLTD